MLLTDIKSLTKDSDRTLRMLYQFSQLFSLEVERSFSEAKLLFAPAFALLPKATGVPENAGSQCILKKAGD